MTGEDTDSWPRHPPETFRTLSGREILIRDMEPADREREQAFVRGLSERARRFRFMSLLKELPPRLLERFIHPDPDRETVLVAVDPETERFLAVARFILMEQGDGCEFAIVVGDDCRGEGIGRHLMARLIEDAEARGLGWIEGIVMRDNQDMKRLLRHMGFRFVHHADDRDVFQALIDLPRDRSG